ncbi:MAG: hypothetical protein LC748_09695 [Thermomicrobia bacterium]|nr:hypothetical protein [Thermomicrobia bacterium]
MVQRPNRAETMMNLLPVILGVVALGFGLSNGTRRNVLIGVALIGTGFVGIVGPRLAPPAPCMSAERIRARRAAAIILPNGIIYLALGILLRIAVPARERGGSTIPITLFALVMGVLSILSGLGALVRARRSDDAPDSVPGHEHREEA